jgi:CRP/FNR family transcriptional regulator
MLRMELAENADVADNFELRFIGDKDASSDVWHMARNELLFEAGDIKRTVYRVESGALCVYRTRPDFTVEVIEHVLAGELVGMGFLERHSVSERAEVGTTVRAISLESVEQLIEDDPHNTARYHEAMAREFAFRRESLVNSARERPMVRLAAFLVAVSNRIREEGGDPAIIDDSVNCGVIAGFLGMSVDLLASSLSKLEIRGLVETAPPHGLRLKDIQALDAIATGQVDWLAWAGFGADTSAPALQ